MQKSDESNLSETNATVLSEREAEILWRDTRHEVVIWIQRIIGTMGLPRRATIGSGTGATLSGRCAGVDGVKLRLLQDHALAEDCEAQSGCEFLLAARAGKVSRERPRGLLYCIVQRTTWRLATEQAQHLLLEVVSMKDGTAALDVLVSHDATPEEAVQRRQDLARVRGAMERLPIADRELMAEIGEGASYAELVPAFGPSLVAVRTRVFRIREGLWKSRPEERWRKTCQPSDPSHA